jgi:hypothetical protein
MRTLLRTPRLFLLSITFLVILLVGIPAVTASATGGIQIWTTPGAYVNAIATDGSGTYGGQTNAQGSYTFQYLPANTNYEVDISADGYQDFVTYVYVTPNIIGEVNQYLQPDTSGWINVNIHPSGGTACVDDGQQCQTSYPVDTHATMVLQFRNLPVDRYHTVTVYTDGYQPVTQNVYVTADKMVSLDITLVPLVPTPAPAGQLTVHSTPAGAAVYLDNANMGVSPIILTNISAGRHTVMFQMSGFQELATEVTVVAGENVDVPGTLSPAQPATTRKAGLSGIIAIIAVGICGFVFLHKKKI